jgi:hypothetical protein
VFEYKPDEEIANCFKDEDVDHLWYFVEAVREYAWTIKNGSFTGFLTAAVQTVALDYALKKPFECVFKTKDFKSMVNRVDMKWKNMGEAVKDVLFFIDSNPKISHDIIEESWIEMKNGCYDKAGVAFGRRAVWIISRKYNVDAMKATAFINGVFLRNNIETPDLMRRECIEKAEGSKNIVKFFEEWGWFMKGVKENNAWVKTVKYLGTDGWKWFEKSGWAFWRCVKESDDNENFKEETSYDWNPYDVKFDFDLGMCLGDEKFTKKYLRLMKNMRVVIEKGYYLTGGLEFGKIISITSERGIA